MRLGTEYGYFIEAGSDLQQLLKGSHPCHAIADHYQFHLFHRPNSPQFLRLLYATRRAARGSSRIAARSATLPTTINAGLESFAASTAPTTVASDAIRLLASGSVPLRTTATGIACGMPAASNRATISASLLIPM